MCSDNFRSYSTAPLDLDTHFGLTTGFIVGWDDANGPREARYDTRAEAEEHGEMLANYGIRYSIHAEGDLSPRERIEAILEADRVNRP